MILFKGKTPFLRSGRAAAQCQRPEATTSPTWPVSTVVISNFCARTREHNSAYLSDASITRLRESFHCAVCKRRKASFFLRQSATFLCQFCCSRDRFIVITQPASTTSSCQKRRHTCLKAWRDARRKKMIEKNTTHCSAAVKSVTLDFLGSIMPWISLPLSCHHMRLLM
ncbi:hypothetical protein C3747_1g867 [Trypanosoma cruzi]|uniref:Uncharacterized protein n=1 Tax=Trypanosoma cruzi TaxID=5693 RepID=A0A2V2XMK9_TRYCR|nr:hypothetical protein C3747_1g867 [Trypanosoma cruzi]